MRTNLINIVFERMYRWKPIGQLLKNKYLPRWVIFLFDALIVLLAFVLSYNLRYSISGLGLQAGQVLRQSVMVLAVYFTLFLFIKPYAGIIRHTTSHDILKIFMVVLLASVVLGAITFFTRLVAPHSTTDVPGSVIVIHSAVTASILAFSRMVIKYFYYFISRLNRKSVPVMIYGAGDLGQSTLLAIERSEDPAYHVVGFIDSNRYMQGKFKSGKPIYSPETAISKIIPAQSVKAVIVAIKNFNRSAGGSQELLNYCINNHIELRKVPPVSEWLNGAFEARQIKKVSIEDLLGREEIRLDIGRIRKGLAGKTILVTGAAGSIGSEIVRQLISFPTGKLILVDQAESALYELQTELRRKLDGKRDFIVVIADISDSHRMECIFSLFRPAIVFNAAAYKHVPLLEDNVYEAVTVNVGGTKILADLAVKYGAEKFVMISTDKAVNPVSIMGVTKRICEIYVQSLWKESGCATQFITTRFGNVLGSNGSVVPLFEKQIREGGPVTVTHRDMKRWFMTIPEACQLVLEAGFMGHGGEIFVFNMGEPVRIYDLAVKMISLAGLEPGRDIEIKETGIRQGEKLFEELLDTKEGLLPTYHPKILIAEMNQPEDGNIRKKIENLIAASRVEPDEMLVKRMKEIVPEFKPANPCFQK